MKISIGAESLLSKNGWEKNKVVEIQDGRITRIASGKIFDIGAAMVTQGLIDPHIHGGNGFEIMHATEEGLEKWLLELARAGVAGVLPAPYTSSMESIRNSLHVISAVKKRQEEGDIPGARILGAHLEGPFINKERLGAMEEQYVMEPSDKHLHQILDGYENLVKEVTLAPEVPGSKEVTETLLKMGILVQMGHSDATFEEGQEAFSWGVGSVCHAFNASRPIHHRDPGLICAAFHQPSVYCEVIADFVHLHPAVVQLLWKCKGPRHFMVVSDAVSTTNLPDGIYQDNGLVVEVKNGVSRVQGGSLNGGGNYLPASLRNLVSLNIPMEQAILACSDNAASWLKMDVSIVEGREAFLTGWDQKMQPLFTYVGKSLQFADG